MNDATAPPPKVGLMSANASLERIYDPFPYTIVASCSLIVKVKLIFLVAPLLLIRSWNVDSVRLMMGVPNIVPLLAPRFSPSGSSGMKVQLIMLPLISVGTMGAIWEPRSRMKTVCG